MSHSQSLGMARHWPGELSSGAPARDKKLVRSRPLVECEMYRVALLAHADRCVDGKLCMSLDVLRWLASPGAHYEQELVACQYVAQLLSCVPQPGVFLVSSFPRCVFLHRSLSRLTIVATFPVRSHRQVTLAPTTPASHARSVRSDEAPRLPAHIPGCLPTQGMWHCPIPQLPDWRRRPRLLHEHCLSLVFQRWCVQIQ